MVRSVVVYSIPDSLFPLMPSLIIGLVGQVGCGKGTVTKHLKDNYNAVTFSFSASMRDILRRLHLAESRNHLITVSEVLRQGFGEDLFSRVIAMDAREAKGELVVIDGIRRPMDIATFAPLANFVLVAIDADIQIRFARIKARGQNSGETDLTWECFLIEEARSTEASIPAVMQTATYHLNNEGSPDALVEEIEKLMQAIRSTPHVAYANPPHPHTA